MTLNNKQLTTIGAALLGVLLIVIGVLIFMMHSTKSELAKV